MDYRNQGSMQSAAPAGTYLKDPETESASAIRDAISGSEQLLSEFMNTIDMLEKRLETVLQPVPPMPTNGGAVGVNQPITSHVRGRLNLLNEGWSHSVQRIRDLMRRVEV